MKKYSKTKPTINEQCLPNQTETSQLIWFAIKFNLLIFI